MNGNHKQHHNPDNTKTILKITDDAHILQMQQLRLMEDKQQSQGYTATASKWQSHSLIPGPLALDHYIAFIYLFFSILHLLNRHSQRSQLFSSACTKLLLLVDES